MCDWVCYFIVSLNKLEPGSKKKKKYSILTYIGASNNQPKRLNAHNDSNPNKKRVGAKRTRGRIWVPIIVVSGFENKKSCLSFEAGWKRLARNRNNKKLFLINLMANTNLSYTGDPRWNRLVDLLYFVHNFTFIGTKFCLNYDLRHPVYQVNGLRVKIFMEEWICDLPWPHFISFEMATI